MAAEIKLTKLDESPWGFRLTGGRDFGTPLTIIKVGVNTVAEQAGLRVGDILVRINNAETHSLSHRDAQNVIRQSGNTIVFSVLRGSLNLPGEVIERLTPLPLAEFANQEPTAQPTVQSVEAPPVEGKLPVINPNIELIPIKDLEPDQLEELGLKPLPEDFLEKAKRDPSPLPEVRPRDLGAATPIPDVLETLEQLGLPEVVQEIKQQEPIVVQAAEQVPKEGDAGKPTEGQAPEQQVTEAAEQAPVEQPTETVPLPAQPELPTQAPATEYIANMPADADFNEIMTGRAEVIEGTNAIGVDFKKYEPQADFLKKSQVFQTIKDQEHQKEKDRKTPVKEKRWTTFMEKPDRPKIKPKPKPHKTQNKQAQQGPEAELTSITPPPTPEPAEPAKQLYEVPSEEEFEALVRVPTPGEPSKEPATTEVPTETTVEIQQPEEVQQEQNLEVEGVEEQKQILQQQLDIEKELAADLGTEEKSDIELQLEEIQKQLEAIQQLPFEIQQHLSLVQDQLSKIVQHRMQEQGGQLDVPPPAPRPSMVDEPEVIPQIIEQLADEVLQQEQQPEEAPTETATQEQQQDQEQPQTEDQPADEKKEFKLRQEEEAPILPPPKVGLDENANDPLQKDMESKQNWLEALKEKKLQKRRQLSKTGDEILAEIKKDPNKVGWKTRPKTFDWKRNTELGLGKGVNGLTTCRKFSGWRFHF